MHARHFDPKFPFAPTVLVAEADDALRTVLCTSLAADGYRVVAVEDGLELFDYLTLAEASGGRVPLPKLVLSDVELAGCTGLAACRRLRATSRPLPVVLIAAAGDLEAQREAMLAGASDVLRKLVDVDELRGIVSLLA